MTFSEEKKWIKKNEINKNKYIVMMIAVHMLLHKTLTFKTLLYRNICIYNFTKHSIFFFLRAQQKYQSRQKLSALFHKEKKRKGFFTFKHNTFFFFLHFSFDMTTKGHKDCHFLIFHTTLPFFCTQYFCIAVLK